MAELKRYKVSIELTLNPEKDAVEYLRHLLRSVILDAYIREDKGESILSMEMEELAGKRG